MLNEMMCNDDPVFGRVVHGEREEDFSRLSADEWKHLSWVFGPDALPIFWEMPKSSLHHAWF